MQPYTASAVYGGAPSPQPTPTPTPDHAPGTPEPVARTLPRPTGPLGNPALIIVALVGIAALLVNFSVRVEVSG